MSNKFKNDSKVLAFILIGYLSLIFLLLFIEKGNEQATINSLEDVIWYSFVTLTTVGYGDIYPVTSLGKLIGVLFVFSSLGLVGYIFSRITKRFFEFREKQKMGHNGTDFKNHIVIVGWDNFSASVTKQLVDAENKVAIITDDKNHIDLIYQKYTKDEVFVLFSDLNNIDAFKKANISNAFLTFVNLKDDTDNLILILNIKQQLPEMEFLVTLDNTELKETFHGAGVTYVLSRNEISSKLIASYIFEPEVADFTSDLLTSARKDDQYDIQQFKIVKENPLLGETYGQAFSKLKKQFNVILIGIAKYIDNEYQLLKLPSDDVIISENDYLILILSGDMEKEVSDFFHIKEGVTR